jgi:hypothetical protein
LFFRLEILCITGPTAFLTLEQNMKLSAERVKEWQSAKADRLLPIVYLRGFAGGDGEIDETTADPFNGFNVGSVLTRTGWTGDAARHVFESPVLRLTQPPFNYRLTFSDGHIPVLRY